MNTGEQTEVFAPSIPGMDLSHDDVANAYVYLLSRYLENRQEQIDLAEPGVDYNVIKYNPVGAADFVNPNLDVAYLEAWIAVDADTPVVLTVPDIADRYYTTQLIDEWGEVIANLNERTFADHPSGRFALIAPGSSPSIPPDAVAIELHSDKAKLLARVELRDDWDGAVELQHRFTLDSDGSAPVRPPIDVPAFTNDSLLGVEAFELAEAVLNSAPDVCPVADLHASNARELARYVASGPDARSEIDDLIRHTIVPTFLSHAVTHAGRFENNWLATLTVGNYGDQYWTRTAANQVGIWANSASEVIYFIATSDVDGEPLDGARTYRMHFDADTRPDTVVDSYWSIILVSLPDYRVVANPDNRFNLNSYSDLDINPDGSLDLAFGPKPDTASQNWLPTPVRRPFSLTLRAYVPKRNVTDGEWFPPSPQRHT